MEVLHCIYCYKKNSVLIVKRYLTASAVLLLILILQPDLKANPTSSPSLIVPVSSPIPITSTTGQTSVPKEIIDWIYAVSAVASAIAAVLAWTAQLRWSQQYKEATEQILKSKDTENQALKTGIEAFQKAQEETVRAKDSEIQRLKGDTPKALMEYVEDLKKLSDRAIQDKNREIENLKEKNAPSFEIAELQAARSEIEARRAEIEARASQVKALMKVVETLASRSKYSIDFLSSNNSSIMNKGSMSETLISDLSMNGEVVSAENNSDSEAQANNNSNAADN